jgi:hypothetical protein
MMVKKTQGLAASYDGVSCWTDNAPRSRAEGDHRTWVEYLLGGHKEDQQSIALCSVRTLRLAFLQLADYSSQGSQRRLGPPSSTSLNSATKDASSRQSQAMPSHRCDAPLPRWDRCRCAHVLPRPLAAGAAPPSDQLKAFCQGTTTLSLPGSLYVRRTALISFMGFKKLKCVMDHGSRQFVR